MDGKKLLASTVIAIGLVAAGGVATALLGSSSQAATTTGSSSATSSGGSPAAAPRGPHTVGSCTESVLTGDAYDKATAAAAQAVPNATADRVETDCDGAPYEVHMTKSDGSRVTVKEDKAFKVTSVEQGMGAGGPPPGSGPRSGPRSGSAGPTA